MATKSGGTLAGGVELLTAELVWPTGPVLALVDAAMAAAPAPGKAASSAYRAALVDLRNALPCKADLTGWTEATGQPEPRNLAELSRQAAVAGLSIEHFAEYWPNELIPWVKGGLERLRATGQPIPNSPGDSPHDDFCVRLLQAAGVAGRAKRTLQNWQKEDADFPLPIVAGGGGQPAEWRWGDIRPYLEKRVKRELPKRHPSDRL
ncbi:MAG: hypothetical protein RBS80_04715 [Thermoguttaceae bacterium]|jgi:hypothetical protein|nr:hypothetical protein [Thermoguttaceae bacterium]